MNKMFQKLKQRLGSRFPRIAIIAALLAPGGYAVYEKVSADDCCQPGAACCFPGSPCCAHHNATAQR
jgi:hypothetical protein